MAIIVDVYPYERCESCQDPLENGRAIEVSGKYFCGECAWDLEYIDRSTYNAVK